MVFISPQYLCHDHINAITADLETLLKQSCTAATITEVLSMQLRRSCK